jgi:Flp pilus assembly protein TadG
MSLINKRRPAVSLSQHRCRGQAMVEFAIAGLIFFMLIFGVIESGRLLFTYHQVNHAAREGARYAVANGSANGSATDSQILSYIQNRTTGLALTSDNLTVSKLDGGNGPRQRVEVTIDYDFDPIVGMIFGFNPIGLSADSTMRYHY